MSVGKVKTEPPCRLGCFLIAYGDVTQRVLEVTPIFVKLLHKKGLIPCVVV